MMKVLTPRLENAHLLLARGGLIATILVLALTASAWEWDKESLLSFSSASDSPGVLNAGNGIYEVFVADAADLYCGAWTATTAALHPAGAGWNVLYGGGGPATSNTTLRSYVTGVDYVTGTPGPCTALCGVAAPVMTPIMDGTVTVGYRMSWTITDGGTAIEFIQTVVVEGPVDGTETIDNTVIRETHAVRNLGAAPWSFGLRKQWDWQVGSDDGPWFGDCVTPLEACDRSMNLTADGTMDGFYPRSYTINEDPLIASCPGGLIPNNPTGCPGVPLYLVAGTTSPPSNLSPPPDPPELLQFNRWSSLWGACWQPALSDNAYCAGGDTAAAYFYGLTAATAMGLAPGEEHSFTQYVVAGEETCPDIIVSPPTALDIKPGSCPNPFNVRPYSKPKPPKGSLPVALLGTEEFDVAEVDVASLTLSRADGVGGSVAPLDGRYSIEDVATPFDGELCDCHELTADGFLDLSLKFSRAELVAALELGDVADGEPLALVLTGVLIDGTSFEVGDCVLIRN